MVLTSCLTRSLRASSSSGWRSNDMRQRLRRRAARGPNAGAAPDPGLSRWAGGLPVTRVLGVYDADGGLRGEAAYVVGRLLGRRHCSLCDVTHSPVRRKPAWDALVRELEVPVRVAHRNELTPAEAGGGRGRRPAGAARRAGRRVLHGARGPDHVGGRRTARSRSSDGCCATPWPRRRRPDGLRRTPPEGGGAERQAGEREGRDDAEVAPDVGGVGADRQRPASRRRRRRAAARC